MHYWFSFLPATVHYASNVVLFCCSKGMTLLKGEHTWPCWRSFALCLCLNCRWCLSMLSLQCSSYFVYSANVGLDKIYSCWISTTMDYFAVFYLSFEMRELDAGFDNPEVDFLELRSSKRIPATWKIQISKTTGLKQKYKVFTIHPYSITLWLSFFISLPVCILSFFQNTALVQTCGVFLLLQLQEGVHQSQNW